MSGRHRARGSRNGSARVTVSVLTALAAALAMGPHAPADSVPEVSASEESTASPVPLVNDTRPRASASARLPPLSPTQVPQRAEGTFSGAGDGPRTAGGGSRVEYRVEVEDGLSLGVDAFAAAVDRTLGDARGWTKEGRYSFERTSGARLRVVLASPDTTDRLCAPLQTRGEVSCRNGDNVVVNARRWTEGVPYYDSLVEYRRYLVNHEIGHALGFGHRACPTPGAPAPVMLQQTRGLQGCTPNPWP